MSSFFSYSWSVICKSCKRKFSFTDNLGWNRDVIFPNGDNSVIRVDCSECGKTFDYKNEELHRPVNPDRNIGEVLKQENIRLKGELKEAKKEIERLHDQNTKLTDAIHFYLSPKEETKPVSDPKNDKKSKDSVKPYG